MVVSEKKPPQNRGYCLPIKTWGSALVKMAHPIIEASLRAFEHLIYHIDVFKIWCT